MVDMRISPLTYKVQVGEVVLNKHVDHMKAATSRTGQEQNISGPSEHPARLSELVGSPPLPSVEDTTKDEMDTADAADSTPLPTEKEDEFLLRCSQRKSQGMVQYMVPGVLSDRYKQECQVFCSLQELALSQL
eukprot:g28524.t1